MSLILHCGGWTATKADLQAVPVPEPTGSYAPVPYGRLVGEILIHVPRFGLKVEREEYALNRAGKQMFGVLTCRNGRENGTYALAIGLRSSYDRSLAIEQVAGTRVFCCDDLAFHGEAGFHRKHTAEVWRDLPAGIYEMLTRVLEPQSRIDGDIGRLRALELEEPTAHHLMVEAVKRDVLPASWIPKLIEAWEKPEHEEFHPRSGWSLYNAFTGLMRHRPPHQQIPDGLRLTALFRETILN